MSAPPSVFDLTGRTAIVTGGSRGMGREIALGLARAGADVVIASRRLERCEEVAEEVRRIGRRALAHACHVGKWDDLSALVDAAYDTFGRIDVLVNNAGMSPVYDTPDDISEALWDKVLDVNLKGPFRLMTLVGRRMLRDGGGSIVNIGSVSAVDPHAGVLPYAAAKSGLNAITLAFARGYGPRVRVNCVMPGAFMTDISDHWDMEEFGHDVQGWALQRIAEPAEMVGTVLYLASDASSFTTGAVLRVDGGFLLRPGTDRVEP